MGSTEHLPEVVVSFEARDNTVASDAEAAFGEDVSSSKRMTGSVLVDVFIKPVVDLIGKVLDFRSRQGERIVSAKIVIGKKQISLEGYGADDAERLLSSDAFREALAQVRS